MGSIQLHHMKNRRYQCHFLYSKFFYPWGYHHPIGFIVAVWFLQSVNPTDESEKDKIVSNEPSSTTSSGCHHSSFDMSSKLREKIQRHKKTRGDPAPPSVAPNQRILICHHHRIQIFLQVMVRIENESAVGSYFRGLSC